MIIPVGDRLKAGIKSANIDAKWGPYDSLEDAFTRLGEEGDDALIVGLTIGVYTSPEKMRIDEYWIKEKQGEEYTVEDFVLKTHSVDKELSNTSINPVQNKVITNEISAIETNIDWEEY